MKNFYPEQYRKTGVFPINHNYLPQQFADHDLIWEKIRAVVQQGDFTLGQAVDDFERAFASLNGGEYAVSVGSGTDALFLALKAIGIGPGDEVITTPFTFYATVGAIVTAGARPVFVDVAGDFNIDASNIEAAITEKTKAIMPVHWSGNPCDMTVINTIAAEHGLKVVADACHAIMANYNGEPIANSAQISCFSMHPLKNLNVWGDGGIVISNDQAVAEKLLLLRNHGLVDRDTCEVFAYNSRLDTIQAVVAQHLLVSKIEGITQARITHAHYLDEHLAALPEVVLPERNANKKHVYHLYMGLFEDRDLLQQHLHSHGIDAKVHYPVPMHMQPAAKVYGYKAGDFPIAEKIAASCLSLPVHEFITTEQLSFVVDSIRGFYNG